MGLCVLYVWIYLIVLLLCVLLSVLGGLGWRWGFGELDEAPAGAGGSLQNRPSDSRQSGGTPVCVLQHGTITKQLADLLKELDGLKLDVAYLCHMC